MPINALELWNASTLEPADLGSIVNEEGELIIGLDATDAEQSAAAVAWVATKILPIATAEVGVPVRNALGDYLMILDDVGLTAKFGAFAQEIIPLWNGAQICYGCSELNKRVDSNNVAYDKDSDQDRIQGNQRLQKLLDALRSWKLTQTSSPDDEDVWNNRHASASVPIIATW